MSLLGEELTKDCGRFLERSQEGPPEGGESLAWEQRVRMGPLVHRAVLRLFGKADEPSWPVCHRRTGLPALVPCCLGHWWGAACRKHGLWENMVVGQNRASGCVGQFCPIV